jgi:hypothetical protein
LYAFGAGLAVTLCGLFAGYKLYENVPSQIPQDYTPRLTYADTNKSVLGENAVVKYIYSYTEDDEELSYEEAIPKSLVGLDVDGVHLALRDYAVCELSEDRLVVKKTIEGRSNAHYLIGEKDGYVAVYFENGILKEKTATPVSGLSPEIKAQILKGVKIDGAEELVKCLEDIES